MIAYECPRRCGFFMAGPPPDYEDDHDLIEAHEAHCPLREDKDGHASRQEPVTVTDQNNLQEIEMTNDNVTSDLDRDLEADRAARKAEYDKFKDPDYKPANCQPWCVPTKCKHQGGPDVMHQGETMRVGFVLEDGESYSLAATPTRLEERGHGWTTDTYIVIDIIENDARMACLNMEIDELEDTIAWLGQVLEAAKNRN